MRGVPEVSVLCEGWLVREGGTVVDASSTVTMIEAQVGKVLVDTGASSCSDALLSALSSHGMAPDEVSHVVNTHLHMDHCGANDLFSKAVFHAHEAEDPPIGTRRVGGEAQLAPGVRLVHTPGHTRGSMTVFVEADRRYAVCGDAIPTAANWESRSPPAIHFDRAVAVRSMQLILGRAQTVIPGHGAPFSVVAKE